QRLAVRGKDQGAYPAFVSAEPANFMIAGYIPQPHGLLISLHPELPIGTRRQCLTIRRKDHMRDLMWVSPELAEFLAGRDLPQAYRMSFAGRCQGLAIR